MDYNPNSVRFRVVGKYSSDPFLDAEMDFFLIFNSFLDINSFKLWFGNLIMVNEQLKIWDESYYNEFVSDELKIIYDKKHRDLTSKVSLDSKFKYLSRKKLDFCTMDNLLENKYSKKKVPKLLLKTLSEFSNKSIESVSVYEMFQLYNSLDSLFDGDIDSKNLNKWSDANRSNVSRFGISQYELLENYLRNLDLI